MRIVKNVILVTLCLCLSAILIGCATNFNLPTSTKTGAISQTQYPEKGGDDYLIGVQSGWWYGLPLYNSFSVYRGTKPWLGDPKTVIATQTSSHVDIQVFADNASPAWGEVASDFVDNFTQTLSAQIDRTWKSGKKRFYDINLLMYPPDTKINRKYRQIFLGKTFHTRFYYPLYDAETRYATGEMQDIASKLAHEYYHLRVGQLGGSNARPFRKDLTRLQKHILNEAAGRLFGSCVELQTKGQIDFRRTVIPHKIDKTTGKIRVGTLSDAMIREALTPGTKIHRDDLVAYGPMLFATYWAQHHGTGAIIKKDDPTAIKMQNLCDNHIAHPTDLWPIFWEMANDGMDAPDFAQLFEKPDESPAPAS